MKKNKSTKAKNKRLVKILIILFLVLIITIICFKKKEASTNKILEATAREAFVAQSILLADNLKNEYTDMSKYASSRSFPTFQSTLSGFFHPASYNPCCKQVFVVLLFLIDNLSTTLTYQESTLP